jgi:hypothetical protein
MNLYIPRRSSLLIAVFGCFLLLAGCGRTDHKETAEGKGESKLTLQVTSKVQELSQDGELPLAVAINRQKFDGPIVIDFPDLPQGVSIKEPLPHTIPAGQPEAIFTLKADSTAEPKKEIPIYVTAKNDEYRLNEKVVQKVTILEGLINRQKEKTALSEQAKSRLDTLDKKFAAIQKQVNQVNDNEAKVTLLRELKNRTEDFGHAKHKFEEFASTPSNSEWEKLWNDLNDRITNLEKELERLDKRLQKDKSNS